MRRVRGMGWLAAGWAAAGFVAMGCPVWRTEHKVETTHKIEAHIVLDIRKVKEEAEGVEAQVRGAEAPKATPDGPQSRATPARGFWSIFDVASAASAAQASEEEEKAAIERRRGRNAEAMKGLGKGCLGENNRGYLEARPCEGSEEERRQWRSLAEAENRDRKIIYAAIAVRQGHTAAEADQVGQIYAAVHREALKKGMPFQAPENDRLYQEFLESDFGKKVSGAKKGAWLAAP